MSDEHLNSLIILESEKDLADTIDPNAAVMVWAALKSKKLRIKLRKWNCNLLWKVFLFFGPLHSM